MLIFDLNRPDGSTMRVGAVGSCRLHDPIKAAIVAGRGRFQWSALNSFTHTPGEARQHLEFCRGLLKVPDGFAPYILRQDSTPEVEERLVRLVDSCDAFVVEMSSLDYLRCGDFFFNQDYFYQMFMRGGGLGLLAWYRALGEASPPAETIEAAVAALRAADRPVTDTTDEILRNTRRGPLDVQDYSAGLPEVAFDRERPWLFMPIFNLPDLPAAQAEKRGRLAAMMKDACDRHGFGFYDPTDVVGQAGRATAMDGGGADNVHYAPDFLRTAGDPILDEILNLEFEFSARKKDSEVTTG